MQHTREEVESFLNSHADTALDSIGQEPRSLSKWIADFTKSLKKIAADESPADDDDDEDDDHDGGLFGRIDEDF